jgi:hypothetical protein
MRWEEEVTLLSYEMQWTIRFLRHKSQEWGRLVGGAEEGFRSAGSAGAIAYATRKQAMWHHMMTKGDRIFALVSMAYQSPL